MKKLIAVLGVILLWSAVTVYGQTATQYLQALQTRINLDQADIVNCENNINQVNAQMQQFGQMVHQRFEMMNSQIQSYENEIANDNAEIQISENAIAAQEVDLTNTVSNVTTNGNSN